MSKQYARVQKSVLERWRAELTVLTETERFRARVDEILHPASVSSAAFFNQGDLGFLRDAHIASRIATTLPAEAVRLCPDQWPDFELKIDGVRRLFEVTEADVPGRRRGDEYLSDDHLIEDDPDEDWRNRFEAIPVALDKVISKKLAKKYSGNASLIVYVNIDCFGAYLTEGVPMLYYGTCAAKDKFSEVLALWEGRLFGLWKNGRQNRQVWNTARVSDF
jgi:hypothetical protein